MKGFFAGLMRWMDRIRRVFINGFLLLFLIIFFSVLFASRPEVPEDAVLVIEPEGRLVEQIVRPSPDSFPFSLPSPDQVLIADLNRALELAKHDPKIRMVRLELEKLQQTPLAKLQDLRKAIESFKQSDKPVVVAGHAFSQSQYYLAASASKLYLHPMGLVELTGFALYQNYFKSALEKLHVDVHLFRAGEYKSAAEPLVRDDMSEPARIANRAWLGTLWEAYKTDIAAMRGIKPERIQTILDAPSTYLAEHDGSIARLMQAEGLVDELADKHDADTYIAGLLGKSESDDIAKIGYRAYLKAADVELPQSPSQNLIGVITASGPIVNGEQPTGTVGGDTIAGLLRDARQNEQIKAVVLRIDSPGGSALASEVIRKEVERVKASGKPVVVSMGSVAASGGYWIAAPADEIWAQPTTITGSIGVFGMMANVHRGLKELGIHTDGLGTTMVAGGLRSDRPLNPELARVFQMGVDDVYSEFIKHVSAGRNMEQAAANQLAQGRVWSGVDAHRLGLVDQLGDLKAAIASAAKRAGVADDYRKVTIEPHMNFSDFFIENLLSDLGVWFGNSAIVKVAALPGAKTWLDGIRGVELFARFNDPRQIYAYSELPY
ncbi:MAG: signal peptide peptidase SppA [Mariprofundaceae bacterium]|nr:signal peptide peptidase SppA [Mariprofundaceae bacterium]